MRFDTTQAGGYDGEYGLRRNRIEYRGFSIGVVMNQTQLTLRLDSDLRNSLQIVSELTKTSMNHLINDAVRELLRRMTPALEQDLEEKLRELQSQAKSDKYVNESIDNVIDAELEQTDPFEGEIFQTAPMTETQQRFRAVVFDA